MTTERVEAYAAVLFEVAQAEGALAAVEEELFLLARAVDANDELRNAITDPSLPAARRMAVIEELFAGRGHQVSTALAAFVVGVGRGRDLSAIVDRFVEQAAAERLHEVAEVRSAIPLDADQLARLEAALSSATGKKIEAKVIIDPSVLGGLVARVGDTVIDGSVRTRIDQLKERI